MAKLTLADITDGDHAVAMNANLALIEAALENTLSRDGTVPNTLTDDFDLNSNFILNMPPGTADTHPLQKQQIESLIVTGGLPTTATNDLLYDNGTALVATAGLLTWDGSQFISTGNAKFTKTTVTDVRDAGIFMQSTFPRITWDQTGATVNNRVWSVVAAADQLKFAMNSDDGMTEGPWLLVDRTLNVVDTIAFQGPVTATSYGGITEANLVDKTAVETVSGIWTHSANLVLNNAIPLRIKEVGGTERTVLTMNSSDVLKVGSTLIALEINSLSTVPFNTGITATSYGGITEANLVDKSASEVITGAREWQGNIGFYSTTPIAQQTGVAVTAAGIHAALVNLGLITA